MLKKQEEEMKRSTDSSTLKKLIRAILLTCFVTTVACVLFLLHGIHINSLSVAGISLERFSLRWNKQLILNVEQISFTTTQEKPNTSLSSPVDLIKNLNGFRKMFSSININKLQVGSLHGRLSYSDVNNIAQVNLSGKNLQLAASILFSDETIDLNLPQFSHSQYGLTGSAKLSLQPANNTFTGDCKVTIADSVPVIVDFSGDEKQLTFQGKESGTITTIIPLIELFELDSDVQPWITDYTVASRFRLESFSGTIPWQQPEQILQTLQAKIKIDNCQYTFAEGLEPIKTEYTRVDFNNGVLNIFPHHGSYYGQDTQTSWLKIDFNDSDNIILTAYITTEAVANKDIIDLLEYYEISLPLEQLGGTTKSNLTLDINLNSSDVNIIGDLQLHDSIIGYEQKKYHVNHASIHLQNSLVTLQRSNISYNQIYTVEATGQLNASQDVGLFSIEVKDFSYPVFPNKLSLHQTMPHPVITYHVQPENDWLDVSESYWELGGHQIKLDPFQTPFMNRSIQVSKLPLNIDKTLNAQLSGSITVDPIKTDLFCQVTHLDFQDAILQEPIQLQIKSDKQIEVNIAESRWTYKDVPVNIASPTFILNGNTLSFPPAIISYSDMFKADISGTFSTESFETKLQVQPLSIANEIMANLIPIGKVLQLNLSKSETTTIINLPEMAVTGKIDRKGKWQLHCDNIVDFLANSSTFSSDLIQSGTFTLTSENKEQIDFSVHLQLQEAIFLKNNSPVKLLEISGQHTQQGTFVKINQDILINLTDKIHIEGNSLSINIPQTWDLIDSFTVKADPQKSKTSKPVVFSGDDIELLFDHETRVLSDKLYINYENGQTKALLDHDQGTLDFTYAKNQFFLKGKDLNQQFMEALSPHIQLEKGMMHIVAQGSPDDYSILINANDLIIKDFTPLNNTLAFLDTIPALITFSWPEYSTKGFPVTSVVAGVTAKKGLLTIESFNMESPVTSMTGTGWANRNTQKLNLDFNMFTKAKSHLSKIPLIGYILVGDEKQPSIRLKVTGDFNDPKVEHSAYEDVLTLPYSILKRTVNLPQFLLK